MISIALTMFARILIACALLVITVTIHAFGLSALLRVMLRWGALTTSGCLPDAESAFYFSGVTYTTLGYGELLLPRAWRMLAPLEALTGILMCGLSTGLFFASPVRLIGNWMLRTIGSEPHAAAPMTT